MNTLPESIRKKLEAPYTLTQDQLTFYQKNQFIKLKDVLDVETIAHFNEVISAQVEKMNTENTALEERSTYGKAFLQLFNLWRENDVVKEFIFSSRLAKIASDLMQTAGVRIYHDQALFKEGGGGADIGPLRPLGTALIGLNPDSQRYMDLHHAKTDVFEAVSERELNLGTVVMAAMVYLVSQYGL